MKFLNVFILIMLVFPIKSRESEKPLFQDSEELLETILAEPLLNIMNTYLSFYDNINKKIANENNFFIQKINPVWESILTNSLKLDMKKLHDVNPETAQILQKASQGTAVVNPNGSMYTKKYLEKLQKQKSTYKTLFQLATQSYINQFGKLVKVPGIAYGSTYKIVANDNKDRVITIELYDELIRILTRAAALFEENSIAYISNAIGLSALSKNMSIELALDNGSIVKLNLIELLNALQYVEYVDNIPYYIKSAIKGVALGLAAGVTYHTYNQKSL